MRNFFAALVANSDEKVYLVMTKDKDTWVILGWENLHEACGYFTDGYNRKHDQNYEGSMSACIHFIMFNPKIVKFRNMGELVNNLLGTDDVTKLKLVNLNSVAGGFTALECNASAARKVYDAGVTPDLITFKK